MKVEYDFNGKNNNICNLYTQISQGLKFWEFPLFLHLGYSGGLGFGGTAYSGYYLDNAFMLGITYPFLLLGGWTSVYAAYKYTASDKPGHDIQCSVWWSKNIFSDDINISGNFLI